MNNKSSWLAPTVVVGFACALAVWVTWFVTHLPWIGLSEAVSLPIVLGVWIVASVVGCRWAAARPALAVGVGSGFVTAVLGLLILGSKLAHPADSTGVSAGTIPAAPLIAAGFLAIGCVIGGFGGLVASMTGSPAPEPRPWLSRFGILAVLAVAPLLFIGGLVTSTNSGMAVPDWPNSYGSNMFLYPLGPRAGAALGNKTYQEIFFEHSHRLFGALIGLTVLSLGVWVFRRESRRWVIGVACVAFALVCLQGLLGGIRVQQGSLQAAADLKAGRWYSMGHGILAQLCFSVLVALAVYLAPTYQRLMSSDITTDPKVVRRVKVFSTALLHSLILQLIFGAMYRHLRADHALWAHIGFSFVVTVLALGSGFMLTSIEGSIRGMLSKFGWGLVGVVILQFMLGWTAFLIGSKSHAAESIGEAMVRTTHQANGALLLALATAGFVWARQVNRVVAPKAASVAA